MNTLYWIVFYVSHSTFSFDDSTKRLFEKQKKNIHNTKLNRPKKKAPNAQQQNIQFEKHKVKIT